MDTLYLAAICAVLPGLRRSTIPEMIRKLSSSKALFEASEADLLATGLAEPQKVAQFISKRRLDMPEKLDRFCKANSVKLVSIFDEAYPKALKEIHDPPLVLYVKGELPQAKYAIGIVGSRDCSYYGLKAASTFASELAKKGIPIISGGAKGIDTAAHEAALRAGGTTVAVLGCGLDIVYPTSNKYLFERIAERGAVISEYPPGTEPRAINFPARNRIIVGLSRGIVVAEAARKSGALITANIAADEGREVYCVPGNIFEATSVGCHDLIRSGAKLVDSVQDILEDKQQWQFAMQRKILQPELFVEQKTKPRIKRKPVINEKPLPESELGKKIWSLLKQGPLSLEDITEQLVEAIPVISLELLELQIQGYVDQDKAQRYFRL